MIDELRDRNIYPTYIRLSLEVWGILFYNSYGEYHIGINNRLSDNIQLEVLEHELRHIENDLPRYHRIIGVDMQYTNLEKEDYDSPSELIAACLCMQVNREQDCKQMY